MMRSNINQLKNLKTLLQNPIAKQLTFMLGIAGSVALGIVLYSSIQEPIYRPLDYQINSHNMATIVDTLEKSGIQYKLNEQDGVIYVAAKDIQMAKLKLSAAGVPRDDGFSFSYLNDQNAIGNSQFLENARYLRALESDLSKTISSIEGIAAARVHIAIPQNNVFADENGKPTASVVLSMAPGLMSDKEKIRAIVQVVASSVPGLDPKDVAITDQYGHYLSSAMEDGLYSAEQLNYQNNIQRYYEKRVETMITPLMGENKITVRVQADIDFTRHEEAKEQFDSNDQVLRSEQTSSEQSTTPGGASGAPGSLSNSPPQANSGQQGSNGAAGAGASGQQSAGAAVGDNRNHSTKNYEIGKSITYKKSSYPKLNHLSVAVVVDNEMQMDPKTKKMVSKPLDKDKISKITELVKATIGFDEKRGDRVTVINSSFNLAKDEEFPSVHLWNQVWFWDMLKKFIGMAIGFGFLFVIYRHLSKQFKTNPNQKQIGVSFVNEADPYSITPEMQELKQEQINRLKELANREPNRVAIIMKNWVGKQ